MKNDKIARILDKILFFLGAWVVMSPWVLADDSAISNWIALILGLNVMFVSIWAMAEPGAAVPRLWRMIHGGLLLLVPWVYSGIMVAAVYRNAQMVGVMILGLDLLAVPTWAFWRQPRRS